MDGAGGPQPLGPSSSHTEWFGHSPLQGEAPRNDGHVFGEPHGQQHLGAEEPRIPDFHPLFQACRSGRRTGRLCGWSCGPGSERAPQGAWAARGSPPPPRTGLPLTLVVAEHLHAGLRVGVVGRFEAQLGDPWAREGGRETEEGWMSLEAMAPSHSPTHTTRCSPPAYPAS